MNKRILTVGLLTSAMAVGIASPAQALMLANPSASNDAVSRGIVHFSGGCTGTLIDKDWVITANHCLAEIQKTKKVFIGPDIGKQESIPVDSVYETAKTTDGKNTYDVGLVKLTKSAVTIPEKIYQGDKRLPIGTPAVAYGWGNIADGWEDKLPTQTAKIVKNKYVSSNNYNMDGVNIKLDGASKHVWGDSGGPAFVNDGELYGVLSGGSLKNEDINTGTTGVYSPVTELHDWMQKVTGINFFDGTHNAEIDKQLEGKTYKFDQVDNFDDTKIDEFNAVKDYIAGVLNLNDIAKTIYTNILPKVLHNQYVDPIVGSNNNGDTLTDDEKKDLIDTIKDVIDDLSHVTDSDSSNINNNSFNDNDDNQDNDDSQSNSDTNSVNNSDSNSNSVANNDSDSVPNDLPVANSVTNATPIVTPSQGMTEGTPVVNPNHSVNAVNGQTGTSNGAINSDSVKETFTDSIKVDTGGNVIPSLLDKIKNIF